MTGERRSRDLLARRLLEETPLGNCGRLATVRLAAKDKAAAMAFRMPLHYPRYTEADYKAMPEWKFDMLLAQYGLHVKGDVEAKRDFAMGAFLWPSHGSEKNEQKELPVGWVDVPSSKILVAVLLISSLVMAQQMLF